MTTETRQDKPLTRFEFAAPHLGSILLFVPAAIGAGVLSLGYFHPLIGILSAGAIAACPFVGAKVVMALQGRESDWRGPTLYSYVWWSVAALVCFAVGALISWLVYPGVDATNEAWAAIDPWLDVAGALQLIGLGLVFCVPGLRFIMWLIKPPNTTRTTHQTSLSQSMKSSSDASDSRDVESRPVRLRVRSALPHLGSLAAAAVGYGILAFPLAILTSRPAPLGVVLMVLWLMTPALGAMIVLAAQERSSNLQTRVIRPYVQGFVVGLVTVALVGLSTVRPALFDSPIGDGFIWVATGALLMVPFAMPVVRFLWSFARPDNAE